MWILSSSLRGGRKTECYAENAIVGSQCPTHPPTYMCNASDMYAAQLRDLFHKFCLVDPFLCKAAVSIFKVLGVEKNHLTFARTTQQLNPSAGSISIQCPFFQGFQALIFTEFTLPVDERPHASHGRPLFDPWQFHSSITGDFIILQCDTFPLP